MGLYTVFALVIIGSVLALTYIVIRSKADLAQWAAVVSAVAGLAAILLTTL